LNRCFKNSPAVWNTIIDYAKENDLKWTEELFEVTIQFDLTKIEKRILVFFPANTIRINRSIRCIRIQIEIFTMDSSNKIT